MRPRTLPNALWLLALFITHYNTAVAQTATIDLRDKDWGQALAFELDGQWDTYWLQLLQPQQLASGDFDARRYPVPDVWGHKAHTENPPPALGYMTYHVRLLVPEHLSDFYLYLPDMPSAYKAWANGKVIAQNGEVGQNRQQETPAFLPQVAHIDDPDGIIDLVLHISNYHYREGGIWFSLKLTDDTGMAELYWKPALWAVFFGSVLIAIGLFNTTMFAFRRQEMAALYFGLLCTVIGLRRLLIDERVLYHLELFDWATLQRIEHLCFYAALPLFMGYFSALYRQYVPSWSTRISWLLICPFVAICLFFSARIYTELNVSFQMLVLISLCFAVFQYLKAIISGAENTRAFGLGLLVLAITVINDVLKANDYIDTPNIVHLGILAFVITQALSLQKRYLRSLSLVEDMSTQLEKRNEELLRMDEFKDEFLATTSHELRTPLQGISGLARLLREDRHDNLRPEQQEKIELISNTSQRLSVLVNDILDFSSIKHGKLTLHRSVVDLNAMADLVLSTLKPTLGSKAVQLSARIEPAARYIDADTFRIQQVLFNLLGNAVKYTEDGHITLAAFVQDQQLVISVTDTGAGIPEEKYDALFQPFEQAHADHHFSASGTGLGLSISRKLVELHGGRLNLSSEVNRGTCVSLEFPAKQTLTQIDSGNESSDCFELHLSAASSSQEPNTTNTSPAATVHIDKQSGCIFVVDDEAINCQLLNSLLISQGFRVEVFQDGVSVLKRLTEQQPDLILLDYMMPSMNGVEVCRLIRQDFDHCELPVMMLTARHQVGDIVSAFGAGANDYLVKPYQDRELLARVHSQLSIRKYWLASQENERLNQEIERRRVLEDELSELNQRLLDMLDICPDYILLADRDLNIRYANQCTQERFLEIPGGMTGQTLGHYFDPELCNALEQKIQSAYLQSTLTETQSFVFDIDHVEERWQVFFKAINRDPGGLVTIMFSPLPKRTEAEQEPQEALSELQSELSKSRRRMEEIEGALRQVIGASTMTTNTDSGNQKNADDPQPLLDPKEAISGLLRQSLNLWERYTSKSKVDLAESSRCWRVYIDGTTVKTRTFDKYLSARSVPDHPRWRAVVRTANYVQANCALEADERQLLSEQIAKVEAHFA